MQRRLRHAFGIGRPTGLLRLPLALTVLAVLGSCSPRPAEQGFFRPSAVLRVVTLDSPTSYYRGPNRTEGLEFDLVSAFAKQLGVGLYMYPVASVSAMRAAIASGKADIAAAQITADAAWRAAGVPAVVYDHIPQIVVYRRGTPRPRDTIQIEAARLSVRAGSPQEHILERLKHTVAPNLSWIETAPRAADPVEDVEDGEAQYALVDARQFSYSRHLYPDVAEGFTLGADRPVQWVVRRGAPRLYVEVNRFFHDIDQSGELAKLVAHNSGNSHHFGYEESRRFEELAASRLPRYRDLFEQAAAATGLDWRLLAAIAYQESKWDPTAESAAGASGLMMLTRSTAESLGVADPTNARENIMAGAKYFLKVLNQIPSRIPEPDRMWFAVAAYNVGFGHVEDARILAQSRGGNPDSWADVERELPLLTVPEWFVRAKRGYCEGRQPVKYVAHVQRFLKLLEWSTPATVADQATHVAPEA
jgi:peptidoglycan lytic transglycosylase F